MPKNRVDLEKANGSTINKADALDTIKTAVEDIAQETDDLALIVASLGTANASLAALGDSLGTMGRRPLYIKTISESMATGVAILQCDEDTCNATRIRIRYTGLSSGGVLAVGYGMSAPSLFSAVCVLRSFDEFVDDVPPSTDIYCILFDETIDGDYQEAVGGINDYVQVSYYA